MKNMVDLGFSLASAAGTELAVWSARWLFHYTSLFVVLISIRNKLTRLFCLSKTRKEGLELVAGKGKNRVWSFPGQPTSASP